MVVILQLKQNGNVVVPKQTTSGDGYTLLEHKFKPSTSGDILTLVHDDVLDGPAHGFMGDYYFKQTMLWTGDPDMAYEKNTSEASRLKTIFDGLNNIALAMKDPGKSYSEFKINANGILAEFMDGEGKLNTSHLTTAGKIVNLIQNQTTTSIEQQFPELWSVMVKNGDLINSINVASGGTVFEAKNAKGVNKLIITPETTYIEKGAIDTVHIKDGSINSAKIMDASISSAKIINLDVDKLTGNFARFLKIILDGVNSSMKLVGDNLTIVRKDGTYSTMFTDNGVEIWRSGIKVGALISLDAIETYGFYNNRKSISLTTTKDSYIGFSYYSEQDDKYYRAFALGGDGRTRWHSPLYAGITNSGFQLSESKIGDEIGSGWRDVVTGGGMIVTRDGDSWFKLTNGYWTSISRLNNKINDYASTINSLNSSVRSLQNSVNNLRSEINSNTYVPPAPDPTPIKPPSPSTGGGDIKDSTGTIRVGDLVKIKSGITTYYDGDDYAHTIPTNLYGRNYRTLTYKVGHIETSWPKKYPYRLEYQGTLIAWLDKNSLVKV